MDPSALIFVALAVAWAVYLIPKALEHHEAGERSRSIANFSHRVRVLGRRDAVSPTSTALVTHDAPATSGEYAARPAAPARPTLVAARRAAVARATKRRRNVLVVLVLLLVATVGAVAGGYAPMLSIAGPVALLAVWLVVCRLMVRKEHAVPVRRAPVAPASSFPVQESEQVAEPATTVGDGEPHDDGDAVAEVVDSAVGRWDPVDVPLPTYVSKPAAARRTVRTIDLDGTGVWSSGRNEADSVLAREADASRQSEPAERASRQTGS